MPALAKLGAMGREQGSYRGRLFRKYAGYFAVLVSGAVLASGLAGLYFAYRDTRALVDELQQEKARAAAARIEQYLQALEAQARGAILVPRGGEAISEEQQYVELLKLLRVAPAVADVAWIDAAGVERLRASRVERDVRGGTRDRTKDPGHVSAAAGKVWYGPVYFRRDTEPHFTIFVPGSRPEAGVAAVDINLKFVWDVVSTIRFGSEGHAYVVDAQGRLISHPDISRVLSVNDVSTLPQVRAALARGTDMHARTLVARDLRGTATLAAYAPIGSVNWSVLAEQPLSEAFAPLYRSAVTAGSVILVGVAISVAIGFLLARRMTTPIRTLETGAARIGDGHLDETVTVRTGDELQELAEQFNRMAQRLRESYSGLEQKIDERTRQLAAANDAKSRFLAAASHDLRQPVHALGLFIAQLEETRDPDAVRGLIERIAASSAALSELLDALLDISKLDAGSVDVHVRAFALQQLFDRIEQAFALAAQSRGLRLRVRPTHFFVATDRILLERIVLNLVSNAVRYTQTGGVLVGARRRGEHLTIEVWDTGVGIADEDRRRIFEEFYRLPGAGDERAKSYGLGLAIVERLAHLLEVPLQVRSVVGRGSRFSVTVKRASTACGELPAPHDAMDSTGFEGRTVLVIDDDASAREAAQGLLEQWSCVVLTAASESEAASVAAAAPPDMIVCDYRLGDAANGIDVIRRLRNGCGMAVPAVLVSGDVTAKLRQDAESEQLHLLQKPLRAARLRALLMHMLATRKDLAA